MEYTLVMTFLTRAGEKCTFCISDVKPNITKDQVTALMDTIITKNIFKTNSGDLVKKSTALLSEKKLIA